MKKFDTKKKKAISLRKQGYSYRFIVDQTGVSKSTLHYWLSEIPYTPNKETLRMLGTARARSGETKSQQKRSSIDLARKIAREELGKLSERDIFMLGIGLYIGEGTKTQDLVRIVNSDARVIRFACAWFKEVCGLNNSNFSFRIHGYPDTDFERALTYWSKICSVSSRQFQKHQVDRRIGKRPSKQGMNPHGTVHLTVRSNGEKEHGVFLARKIVGWMDTVLEYTTRV